MADSSLCSPSSSPPASAVDFAAGSAFRKPAFFLDDLADEKPQHFLDACSLCDKPLGPNADIYMYRGDTPFCSEECRQEQIEMDEAAERSQWKMDSMKKTAAAAAAGEKREPGAKAEEIHARAGTVVAG